MQNEVQLLFPGDSLEVKGEEVTIGPNLTVLETNDSSAILESTKAGVLLTKKQQKAGPLYYVDSPFGRYGPQVGDFVLGTVVGQLGEFYKISLNEFSSPAILNMFAFPNASKKNRPRLEVRDLVYARVESTHNAVDPELSCVDAVTGKDGGFGVLKGGYCFNVSSAYARYLLYTPNAPVLSKLVEKVQFEMAIGVNGKIWVKCDDEKLTLLCVTILSRSQTWSPKEITSNVEKIGAQFKKI